MSAVPLRAIRGRTRAQRLSRLDEAFAFLEARRWATLPEPLFVDVGFGESLVTTRESASRLLLHNSSTRVIAVEADPVRADRARAEAIGSDLEVLEGGFDLPLGEREADLVRVMNVLRLYREEEVPQAHELLGRRLRRGGLLIEGTSDARGSVLTAHFIRRRAEGLFREALIFCTDFTRGSAPLVFRDWMPRDLRRRIKPGHPVHAFLLRWTEVWNTVRKGYPPAGGFRVACEELARIEPGLDARLAEQGICVWRPPAGVPLGAAG